MLQFISRVSSLVSHISKRLEDFYNSTCSKSCCRESVAVKSCWASGSCEHHTETDQNKLCLDLGQNNGTKTYLTVSASRKGRKSVTPVTLPPERLSNNKRRRKEFLSQHRLTSISQGMLSVYQEYLGGDKWTGVGEWQGTDELWVEHGEQGTHRGAQ